MEVRCGIKSEHELGYPRRQTSGVALQLYHNRGDEIWTSTNQMMPNKFISKLGCQIIPIRDDSVISKLGDQIIPILGLAQRSVTKKAFGLVIYFMLVPIRPLYIYYNSILLQIRV
jgi:hypothetical protein